MNLSNRGVALAQGMFVSSSTAQHVLGTRGYTKDGRAFRYVLAGGTSLVAGTAIQSPVIPTGQNTRAVNTTTSTAVGSLQVTLTCGSSVAAGFYNAGYLTIASGAGAGYDYTIQSHPAVSTGATGIFTLYGEDALQVAITTTSTVTLTPNKYSGVVIFPTTGTGVLVGVATYVITNAQYGWVQTWGPCAVKGADTTAIGAWVYVPATTAGEVSGFTAATLLTGQAVGRLMRVSVAQEFVVVDLTISP